MTKEKLYLEYLSILQEFKNHLGQMTGECGSSRQESSRNDLLLSGLHHKIKDCKKCSLSQTRKNLVFGQGSPNAKLMFVGEAPGKDEDLQGKPFVGAAGKLLRESIKDLKIADDKIYIANILKCRPPGNRNPQPEEITLCLPYLKQQIDIIKPRIICLLGTFAAQTLLNTTQGITRLRGKKFSLANGMILIPTYHPAACIYRPPWKQEFLTDLKKIGEALE